MSIQHHINLKQPLRRFVPARPLGWGLLSLFVPLMLLFAFQMALTIALETGDIGRFAGPGNFASYARTVDSRRESNGKKKGEGNAKCGNKHLAWAFIEAAHFAVRYDATIKRWYQKKSAHSLAVVAIKAVAHKLARACYHVIKSGQPFDAAKAFG